MAQVILNIENDDQFNDIIKNGISALNPEQLQEVILSCISNFLQKDNYKILEQIFINKSDGYYSNNKYPSQTFKDILSKLDYSKLQDIINKIMEDLNKRYKEVLTAAVSDMLVSSLVLGQSSVTELIKQSARIEIDKFMNEQN